MIEAPPLRRGARPRASNMRCLPLSALHGDNLLSAQLRHAVVCLAYFSC